MGKESIGTAAAGVLLVVGGIGDLVLSWLAATTATNAFGAVVLFIISFVVLGFVLFLLIGAVGFLFETDEEKRARAAFKAQQPPTASELGRIPLTRWRGLAMMTKAPFVGAHCNKCGAGWTLEGRVANTIADQQNLANRMIRGGTKMEQFGATFTPGASGRRIAAGNESERHDQDLATVLAMAACPKCRTITDVYLIKP